MEAPGAPEDDERDWRLSGEMEGDRDDHGLRAFVERLHEPDEIRDVRAAVGEDVVITHDGSRLFAYAFGRQAIEQARARRRGDRRTGDPHARRDRRQDDQSGIRAVDVQLGRPAGIARCEIIEHPHLLSSQVAFTVTGPPRKVEELAEGLNAEERRMIRTETGLMLSPL